MREDVKYRTTALACRVILGLWARADFQPFLDVAVAQWRLRSDEETKGQDIERVPHTAKKHANSSISKAFEGLQKSLMTCAHTEMLRGPKIFASPVRPPQKKR